MRTKDHRLWAYNLALVAIVAFVASRIGTAQLQWPPFWVFVAFASFQLVVWQKGFPLPSMGMTSMERVPQVAAILLFPVPVAAAINAIPSLVWPFVNHRYRQGSLRFGTIRAIHNACMTWLMTVSCGSVFAALGGDVPLTALGGDDVVALIVSMIVLQLVNSSMMITFFALDGRDVRRIVTWSYLLTDELFVPIGVLAALVCSQADAVTIALFVGFVLLTVISLHEIVESRRVMQERVAALDAASSTRHAVSGSRRIDELAERLLSRIGAMFQFQTAFIALHDAERGEFDVLLEIVDGVRQPRLRNPDSKGLCGHVLRTQAPLLIDRWQDAPAGLRDIALIAPDERPGSVLMVPITQSGQVLGVVSIQHEGTHRYSDADKFALIAIAEDVAPAIADARTFQELDEYRVGLEDLVAERTVALERAAEEREQLLSELRTKGKLLERQSREDSLTGLANRRHFDERIVAEIERAQRYRHPLSLALIDLDHFKRINDSGGHALGDAVLARIAAVLIEHFRASDLVARIGGEEFAVLLPETSLSGALASANQLRERLAATDFADLAPWLRVAFSAGISEWQPSEHRDALMKRADAWLYAAKAGGRDRICADQYTPS